MSMAIAEALKAAGVTDQTLSADEKRFLDENGYLPLRGILSPEQVEELRDVQATLLADEGDDAGKEVHQEAGTDRLSDLINKHTAYHVVISHPKVLASIAHVLGGDLKLSSLNSRAALPGSGLQGLHADWGRLEKPGDYQVCNSIWLLDDFTPMNGATRVVPGTHLQTNTPSDVMSSPTDEHPDQIIIEGKAGDVVIFNSHLWHGGTINQTENPRRALHGYFTRRHQPQQLDQQKHLRSTTREQLSESARTILGVE